MKTARSSGNVNGSHLHSGKHMIHDVDKTEKKDKKNSWNNYGLMNEKENKNYGKSTHIEDWEEDPYSARMDEDDVKGEFEIRKNKDGRGKSGRGNDFMDEENERWRMHDSGTASDDVNTGNEYRKPRKGTDETLGVP